MRYVILRDDDTNALTPVAYLERLYRPFLDRGMPVNLATIPSVRTEVTYGDGIPEGFLVAKGDVNEDFLPISAAPQLVDYLKSNSGYHVVQHGCHHEFVNGNCEFDHDDRTDISKRLNAGQRELAAAGFPDCETFVAPYDRLTRVSYPEVAARFRLISTGWFEWRRLPIGWLPAYTCRKLARRPHWRANGAVLLSHPGCQLSYHRDYKEILPSIQRSVNERTLTVVVTHWWEFFRENQADEAFIDVLHETAEWLARADIRVVTFRDVAEGRVPLN